MNKSDEFIQFCSDYKLNGFSFPSITTEKKRGKWDKKVNWGEVRWQKNKNSEIKDSHKGFAIRTGKDSDITVIDCDNIEVYNKITEEYPSLLNTLRIKTNRGYHLYLKYNEVFKSNSDSFINFGNYKGLDIKSISYGGNTVKGIHNVEWKITPELEERWEEHKKVKNNVDTVP